MAEEKLKEKQNTSDKYIFDDSAFKIFDNDEELFSDNLFNIKNEVSVVKEETKPAGKTYSERIKEKKEKIKKAEEKREERKKKLQNLKKNAGWFAALATVIAVVIYAGVTAYSQKQEVMIYNENELMREADRYALLSMSSAKDSCTINVNGIICNPDNPYVYGTIRIFDNEMLDSIDEITMQAKIYEYGDKNKKMKNRDVNITKDSDEEGVYNFEIYAPKDAFVNENYTVIEINKITIVSKKNKKKQEKDINFNNLNRTQQIPNDIFGDNKYRQYYHNFSYKGNEYYLDKAEFGYKETLVGFKFYQSPSSTDDKLNSTWKDAQKMAEKAYLIVDGKEIKQKESYRIEDVTKVQHKYLIGFEDVPENAVSVILCIGDSKFLLK